jgi:glycerol-3-phosphate O-acyltransferase / dihydroxyacetone phosphate acyltransferase
MLSRIIIKLVGWAVGLFYDVERSGPPLVDGPVLVAANHPNALVDPLVVFRTGGRASRPMAKAPLFDQAVVGTVLRGLGGLPVYRREDDPALMHLNDRTFDAAVAALHAGQAVQIYPEGRSHSEPSLTPVRTGAARIALRAEAERDWTLGLAIQPVGLTYARKHLFRGRVLAVYGEPFQVDDLRELYQENEREAVRVLTDRIRSSLERLTLNFEYPEDRELVEVAERLYAREKRLVRFRERDRWADRVPRMRRFAEGVRWLRAADPEWLDRILDSVRRYLRLLTLLGASEGDVPPRYKVGVVLRYSVRQLFMLVLVFPAALAGVLAWSVAFLATRRLTPRFRPKLDQIATYKIATALFVFPIWFALLVAAAWLIWGWVVALAALGVLPPLGLAAVAWREREGEVLEDLRVFRRAVRLRRGRDRMREYRARLVAEFDRVMEEWLADGGEP